ncbi:MAG: motility protein A [Pseudomonadota bacterium]
MNPSTLLGMLGGITLVVVAVILTAQDSAAFLNLPGLAVVLGGTLAATLLAYPLKEVLRVFRTFAVVLRNEKLYADQDMKELVSVARFWFKGDLASIENQLAKLHNPFLKTGVQMIIDETPADEIAELMQWRIARLKAAEAAEAHVYRTMAMFAPAFGMLGTLIGLINMLHGMEGSDFERIGVNMGLALLTTLYGVALANLLFKPIAIKFERRTEQRVVLMNVILEGVLLMARGHTPAYIREFLRTFIANYADELYMPAEQQKSAPDKQRRR